MSAQQFPVVIKVFTEEEYSGFRADGTFWGSEKDLVDGFIHLSTLDQVEAVKNRHFAGRQDLVLCHFLTETLSAELKWEASDSGELYPHLYRELREEDVLQNPEVYLARARECKDSNGTPLNEGDSVAAIKDLKVKGGGSMVIKRGTVAKGIRITDDPRKIDCKIDGVALTLETQWFKKV